MSNISNKPHNENMENLSMRSELILHREALISDVKIAFDFFKIAEVSEPMQQLIKFSL